MLQIYDKALAASALALAALAAPALADTATDAATCDLTDGYAATPAAFAAETAACRATANLKSEHADMVRALSDRHRAKFGMAPLERRTALDAAAEAHAADMAARSYAAHEDLEGRSHLDRIRALDRSMLIGAAGANVAATRTSEGSDVYAALTSDLENLKNLTRPMFTHMGVGVAEGADGMVYVAQVFVQVDGELDAPMPTSVGAMADLTAQFAEDTFTPVGWALTDGSGRTLDRGFGRRLVADLGAGETGYLTVQVERGVDTYALKGPLVSGR